MAVITARVDDDVKRGLENFADEVGTSVSGLINMGAKKVLRTRKFVVGFGDKSNIHYDEVNKPMQERYVKRRIDVV